ncbi:hypothetical protein ACPPVO_39820 [Dactylosporangium sp. McL0621]|uniref:hypothetical protein n=1 Tax=Dactylosporangium sp. McL0621 TaxID=3415678 RepID=UPI003CEFF10B
MATLTGALSAATDEVFRSRRRLTAGTATTLGLTALAPAAEARRAGRRPDRLLVLACEVTLLEQRIAGGASSETIVVAHA